MIEYLEPNVPKEKIGAYSGAIESLFALFQFLTSYHWGKLSDNPSIGRKVSSVFFSDKDLQLTTCSNWTGSCFLLTMVQR